MRSPLHPCRNDEVIHTLLSTLGRLEGQEIAQFLEDLLLASIPENPFLFAHALHWVVSNISECDAESTLMKCLIPIAMAGWSKCLQITLEGIPNLKMENAIMAYEAALGVGHATAVSILQRSLTEADLAAQQLNEITRLAVQRGHTELMECLLPQTNFVGAKRSFKT